MGTLIAAAVVALGISAWRADSALGARPLVPAAREGAVTSLSIVPGKGAAEVIIGVSGPVTVRDFTLHSPDKIVVDLTGATLRMAASNYDEANRGGIVDVRYSQYRKNVVRVVLTLDEAHKYNIVRYPNEIRVKVAAEEPVLFVAWRIGDAPVAIAQTGKPAAEPTNAATTPKANDKPKATDKTAAKAAEQPAEKPESFLDKAQNVVAKAADKVANMWAFTEAGLDTTTGATVVPEPAAAKAAPVPARPTPKASAARAADADPTEVPDPLAEPALAPPTRRTQRAPEPRVERPAPRRATQPRITVAWQQAPIRDVIAAFALFSGKTIVVGKGVAATVDAEIADQPWDVAMSAILAAHGLAAQEDANGIIVVDTYEAIASRVAAEPLTTRTIRLNYTRAATVAQMVTQRLSRDCSRFGGQNRAQGAQESEAQRSQQQFTVDLRCPIRGAVTADSLTNSISVTDVPSNLAQLEQYTRGLDIRQPQVSIRAKIILIDRTQLEGLGLRYDLGTRDQFFNTIIPRLDSLGQPDEADGRVLLGGNAISAIANASNQIAAATLSLVYSTAIGKFDFSTFLEALQESSLLDVQSEPSVVTLNNRTANLTAGTQVPVRVLDAGAAAQPGGSGLSIPRATVQFRQTGIILNVTPSITANRQVQMRVHAENSDVQFTAGDAGAIFPTQSVDNELLVADGETAVMGGLTQTTVRITKSGIPLLVDLPLIGRLFGVTNRSETKRDLLILITPHIVDDGGQTPPEPRRDR
jgi:type IV pilus assembly protein PilQ